MAFALDPRLADEAAWQTAFPLCTVLLRDEARWPWAVLVPRIDGASELFDLGEADRRALIEETVRVAAALRALFSADKINVGMLGNIVAQLHVHVVARHTDDPAWPGPVWGFGSREPMDAHRRTGRIAKLESALS